MYSLLSGGQGQRASTPWFKPTWTRRQLMLACLAVVFLLVLLYIFYVSRSFRPQLGKIAGLYPDGYDQNFPEVEFATFATQELGYTAVILYLASASRLRELMLSLSMLHENVQTHPWPILLLHTDDLNNARLRKEFELRLHERLGVGARARETMRRIEWVRLDESQWRLPPGMSYNKEEVKPVFDDWWPGYHIMCGFFAQGIFDLPQLQNVTYYMRLDTDSYVYAPLCYDPLERAHKRGLTYAYRSQTTDPVWVTRGMWDFVDNYARAHPEVEETMRRNGWTWPAGRVPERMRSKRFPMYYNNFEIVRLDAFKRPDVQRFLNDLMSVPERVYKYRWGDAPIRYATVNMFFDVNREVEGFCGMDYYHREVQKPQCPCEPNS